MFSGWLTSILNLLGMGAGNPVIPTPQRILTVLDWGPLDPTTLSWELVTPTILSWSENMAVPNTQNQSMDPLYQSEDVLQGFLGDDSTNPSSFTLVLTFSLRPGSTPLVTINSGFTFVEPTPPATEWQINVVITEEQTALLQGNVYWDLWRTDTGSRNRLAGGNVIVQIPVIYPV